MNEQLFLSIGPPGQNQSLTQLDCDSLAITVTADGTPEFRILTELTEQSVNLLRKVSIPYDKRRRLAAIRITPYDTSRILFDGDAVFELNGRNVWFLSQSTWRPPASG